jgi:FdhD protein
MSISKYQGVKIEKHIVSHVDDALTVEDALAISINGEKFMVTMRTPGDERELVRGLLYSEDIYRKQEPDLEIEISETDERGYISKMDVTIPTEFLGDGYKNSRSLLSVSSCGICGKQDLVEIVKEDEIIQEDLHIGLTEINEMYSTMEKAQHQFTQTGGIHAAAIFDKDRKMLTIKEDIGRHNAVDKAIGGQLLDSSLKEAEFLLVSGRVSYEIVTKAFAARIPFLAAVSAPSSLAVDYAKELGITLMGFCRTNKFTVYSNVTRVVDSTTPS